MDDLFRLRNRKDLKRPPVLPNGHTPNDLIECTNQSPKAATDEYRQVCEGLLMTGVNRDVTQGAPSSAHPLLTTCTFVEGAAGQGSTYKVDDVLDAAPINFAGRKRKISEVSDLLMDGASRPSPLPPSSEWRPQLPFSLLPAVIGLNPAANDGAAQHRNELRQHMLARERRRQFFSRTYRATHPTSGGRVDVTLRGSPSAISHLEMASLPFSRRLSSSERVAGRDALTALIRRSLYGTGPLSSRTLPVATTGLQPTLVRGQNDARPLSRTNSCLVNIAGRPARMSITVTHRAQGAEARQRTCHGGNGNITPGYPFFASPLQVNNYVNPVPFGFAYQDLTTPSNVAASFARSLNAAEHSTVPSTSSIFSPVSSSPIYEEIVNLDENMVFHNYMRGTDFRTIDAHTLVYKYTAPGSHSPKKRKTEAHAEKCPICLDEIGHLEYVRRLPCLHLYHRDCIDRWLQINRRCPVCRNDITGKSLLDGERSSIEDGENGDCSDGLESDYEELEDYEEDGDELAEELALLSPDE